MKPTIALLNQSSIVSDKDAALLAVALQTQVSRDFAPIWNADATVDFIPRGADPPRGCWWLVLLDDSDQASALGYHETTPEGYPIGKVFCVTTRDDGGNYTITASHELLEMLADSDINLCADVTGEDGNPVIYAYECADSCEGDQFAYSIGGIAVSDFVTPAWFFPGAPKGSSFDFRGHISEPLELLEGGYIGVWTPRGWSQITPNGSAHHSSRPEYSGNRWTKRRVPRAEWRPSTAHAASDQI